MYRERSLRICNLPFYRHRHHTNTRAYTDPEINKFLRVTCDPLRYLYVPILCCKHATQEQGLSTNVTNVRGFMWLASRPLSATQRPPERRISRCMNR
jgi:hypothetical protein